MDNKIYFLICIFKYFKPHKHKNVAIIVDDNKVCSVTYEIRFARSKLKNGIIPLFGNSFKEGSNGIVIG